MIKLTPQIFACSKWVGEKKEVKLIPRTLVVGFRVIGCWFLVVCQEIQRTKNKELTTFAFAKRNEVQHGERLRQHGAKQQSEAKRRAAIPPIPRRNGLPAAFCEFVGAG